MGFAPFGRMPIMRRAPYVALVLWPGGYENEQRRSPDGSVGVIDARLPAEVDPQELWKTTPTSVGELMADAPEDLERLRSVAFCLDEAAVGDTLGPETP